MNVVPMHETTDAGWPICKGCGQSITRHHLKGLEVFCSANIETAAAFTPRQVADLKLSLGMSLTASDRKKLGTQGRLEI